MNAIDVVVGVLVVLAALRGYLRGFFRELFGLIGLGAALLGALEWAPLASERLLDLIPSPILVREALAFVGVFVAVNVTVNVVGFALDRLATSMLLGVVNRLAGVLFGAAKAAVAAAVVLLFVQLFAPADVVGDRLATSRLAPPLLEAASDVLQAGHPPRPLEEKATEEEAS